MRARALVVLLGCGIACAPDLGTSDAIVTSPRVLAVIAEPAEAAPGTKVTFTALVASPDGTATGATIAWRFCTAPLPLTEDDAVSSACFDDANLVSVGSGASVAATLPGKGCSLFGPDVSSSAARPRDPDTTGGYYQPLRVDLPGAPATFDLLRLRCDLANAGSAAAAAFAATYQPNQNPTLLPLTASVGGAPASLTAIPRGQRVSLQASWPAEAAESFVVFDPATQSLGTQREALRVAWYASVGSLDTGSTGRSGEDLGTTTTNGWVAPGTAGTVRLWVVLRDSRGGVAFAEVDVTVE